MPSEKDTLLVILKENGNKMELWRLRQEMITRKALGYGVKVDDLICHLLRTGQIVSDNNSPKLDDNEVISIK